MAEWRGILADLREEIERVEAGLPARWVLAEERMPEERALCLVVHDGEVLNVAWCFRDGLWHSDDGVEFAQRDAFTHWMPMPEAPK